MKKIAKKYLSRISLKNQQNRVDFFKKRIVEDARKALECKKSSPVKINIVVVSASYIKSLNRKFLKKDRATDVLSFDLANPFEKSRVRLLGDVFICADVARERIYELYEGALNKTSLKALVTKELSLYAVHGILHLLGFNDRTKKMQSKMQKKQNEILGI